MQHCILWIVYGKTFIPSSLVNTLGLRGTYQGLTATIVKQGSNQAIRFFVYTSLKKWLQQGDNSKDIGSVRTFLIGGVAGAASVFGNTPVDVVKTRMQVCGEPHPQGRETTPTPRKAWVYTRLVNTITVYINGEICSVTTRPYTLSKCSACGHYCWNQTDVVIFPFMIPGFGCSQV